jgi:DNA-binding IclR family transcriptional regulator
MEPPLEPLSEDPTRIVKSDETMFAVIERIESGEEPRLTDIAADLGISKSAVFKHIETLKKHGFVTSGEDGYRIGLRFLEIGLREQRRRPLYHIAKPKIEEVADETGKLVWCVIEENGLGVFLCGSEGDHAVNTDAIPGRRMHMHYLSGGKAMLAEMDEHRVQEIVDRYGLPGKTDQTITDESELTEELARIREQGFALDFEESLHGLHTVASPVLTDTGQPVAAVIIAGAARRMGRETCREEISEIALAAANEIELDMQYA